MYQISNKVDFYITNVCNLTCKNCNRFNNHNFRGWQRWSDYESDYQQWSKLVGLSAATIMGGEPFLNPTLGDWIQGINDVFDIEVQVLTNGTRFQESSHLYQKFLYRSKKNQCQNHIGVSLHNVDQLDQLQADILDFLQGPVGVFPKGHQSNPWDSDWHFVDKNNVFVNVYLVDHFGPSAIKSGWQINRGIKQHFSLHNSDPVAAHNNCAFAKFKSYHFIRGKLYKCGPVALLPEFDQQHQFNISESDRKLLNSYQPLDPDNFAEHHLEFFKNLDQPIAQCKFCPTTFDGKLIAPTRKGL